MALSAAAKKAGYVEHVQEGQSSMREAKRPALTSVMTLDPSYFPEELYSKRDKQYVLDQTPDF